MLAIDLSIFLDATPLTKNYQEVIREDLGTSTAPPVFRSQAGQAQDKRTVWTIRICMGMQRNCIKWQKINIVLSMKSTYPVFSCILCH